MSNFDLINSEIVIKADGTALTDAVMETLIDVVVEDDLEQPAMATLRFHDPNYILTDGTTFTLGKALVVSVKRQNNQVKPIFTGEITAIEVEGSRYERSLVIRGYDKSHRLYRGRKTRTFLKQSDSAIASAIIQEAGLQADVQNTSNQNEYVMQHSQHDMEFLRVLAARNGYQIMVDGSKIKFRSAETSPPEAPAQELDQTLISFSGRLSAVGQPNSVEVRGWNPKTKQAVVGSATTSASPSAIGDGKKGGAAAQTAFSSSAKIIVSSIPVRVQAEATNHAQALLDQMASSYLSAEGCCIGEPAIKAGVLVPIVGVGAKFSGKYFVTASRHEYTPQSGYQTTFVVNGRRPNSMVATLNGGAARQHSHGAALGIVTNINDPDSLGRVKLKFPWLDEQQETDWAWTVTPGAGPTRGMEFTHEVNDQVLVMFEHGEISRPFVLGGVWSSSDAPPGLAVADSKVKAWAVKARGGHTLTIENDDGSNKGAIIFKTAGGQVVTISDTEKKIEIKSAKHTVTLDDQGNAVKLASGGTLELSAGGNKLSFTQSGLELSSSGGKLAIAAAGVELSANANLTLKANANCDVQANAMLNIKSSAILNIQGTLVKIN